MPQKTPLEDTFGAYEDLPDLDAAKPKKKNFGGMPDKAAYEKVATEDAAEAPPAAAAGYPRSIPLTNCGPYLTNYVSTTKYSRFTFLPMATIAQYKRAANVYLLFIAVLCCIPAISPLMPIAAVMPVVFVLTISLLREGAEDYARYKSDEDMNNKVRARWCWGVWESKKTTTKQPGLRPSTAAAGAASLAMSRSAVSHCAIALCMHILTPPPPLPTSAICFCFCCGGLPILLYVFTSAAAACLFLLMLPPLFLGIRPRACATQRRGSLKK
jgi:hypothetical protein